LHKQQQQLLFVLLLLLTTRANGALRTSSPVLFWYLRISCKARVPGLYLCFFSASGCRTDTHNYE
jgi:hypothetical protein